MSMTLHIFWALANSLWQSAVLATLAALAVRFSRTTAAQQHALWEAVLLAALVLPLVNAAVPARIVPPGGTYSFVVNHVLIPKNTANRGVTAQTNANDAAGLSTTGARTRPFGFAALSSTVVRRIGSTVATSFVALWAIGALDGTFVLAAGLLRLRSIKRALVPCQVAELEREVRAIETRSVTIGFSSTITEPCLVGFRRPAVVLPHGIERSLSPADLVLVVRHECAHARRYDDVANFTQRFSVAVLWFNPVVHFAARRAELAREIACDDAAAAAAPDRIELAQCLHAILRARTARHRLPVTGSVRTKTDVAIRVGRLLDTEHRRSLGVGTMIKAASIAILLATIPFAYLQAGAAAASSDIDITTSNEAIVPAHGVWSVKLLTADLVRSVLSAKSPNGQWSFGTIQHLADFGNVSRSAFDGNGSNVAFASVRDAGTLDFAGRAGNSAGSGTFSYVPNPQFAQGLGDRGIAGLTKERQFEFTLAGESLATIDGLRDLGLRGTAQDFLRAAERNVQASNIKPLIALGVGPADLTEALRFHDLDIDADYVAGLKNLGYAPNSAQLIRLREHGLGLEPIRRIKSLVKDASIDDLITLSEAAR